MYRFLLILFLSLSILNSQEFKFFRLNAEYINSFKLSNEQYLLTTNSQSCIIYDSQEETTKEYYTGLNGKNLTDTLVEIEKVKAAEIKENLLFLSTDSSNRFINLVDNSILVDSSRNEIFSFTFLDNGENIIGIKEDGEIYKITLNANENGIEYELIKNIDKPLFVFRYNESNHIITNNGDIINYEKESTISSIYLSNKKLLDFSITDNYFNLHFSKYYLRYDKSFNFVDSIYTNSYYYIPENNGYYIPRRESDSLRIYRYNENDKLVSFASYYLPLKLEILKLNGVFSNENKIIIYGKNKFITSFDKESNTIHEKSIFKCATFPYLYLNKASFIDENVGGVASSENSLYLTRDGGTSWNRFYEFNNENNRIEFFNEIHLLSDSAFVAMGTGFNSTVHSTDFGMTYINQNNPSTNEGFGSFFKKLETQSYISIYDFQSTLDVGHVLSFQKIDGEFDGIHSDYLQNLWHHSSANIGKTIKTIAYDIKSKSIPYYIIETDTNFSYFKYDSLSENIKILNGVVAFQDNFYLLAWDSTTKEQFLMKNTDGNEDWTKVISIDDNYMLNIYAQNENLYLLDTNYTLSKLNLEKLNIEYLAQLQVAKPFLTSINIFDDVIYASYTSNFYKGIKIPEFNSNITNVSIEAVPTFSLHNPYPNPTSAEVKFKLDYDQSYSTSDILLELYNLNGEKVKNHLFYDIIKYSNSQVEINIDFNDLQTGIYFVKINFGNKTEFIPIVKE